MGGDVDGLLDAARVAYARGDLDAAYATLCAAAERGPTPLVHRLLGGIHYAEDRFDDARREWELAFRGFRDADQLRDAARVGAELAELHHGSLGNEAAGAGWLQRSRRLLDRVGPCVEQGYLELAYIACDRPDIDELEASAERALAIAVEFGDHELEVRALADLGLALVSHGRVREGFRRLDEAMAALSAGEVADIAVAGRSFCAMLSSCDRAGDLRRAEEWTRIVRELVLDPLAGRPRVLSTHCLVAYGSVLWGAGRWPEAEQVMEAALSPSASRSEGHRVEVTARLAGLRLDQGRVEEAARLLAPYEDRLPACEPLARIHLTRGEPDLAAAVVRRALDELVGDVLRGAGLLAVLVDAELARGDVDAAERAAAELASRSATTESTSVAVHAALADARILAARGQHERAIDGLRAAKTAALSEERPALGATLRLELADALATADDTAAAVDEARAALSTFERLGMPAARDRAAALLRRLGAATRPGAGDTAASIGSLSSREADVLALVRAGLTNAEIAARLYISPKTAEHHVGRILAKLGVRSRAEAAAVAAAAAVRAPR